MKIFKSSIFRFIQVFLPLGFLLVGATVSLSAQNQCAGGLVGTATGCGALITVLAVDGNGKATAITVTTPGNGNPYDSVEDTLVGVQNNSGATLYSMPLSSSDTTFGGIFNFDGDGPCNFKPSLCFVGSELYTPTGYEGPNSTFTGFPSHLVGNFTYGLPPAPSGTVNFSPGISTGGSSWFAMEGTPASFGQVSQTQTIFPGQTYVYPIGNDNYKVMPFNNLGGELLTLTAFLTPRASFVGPAGFTNESCVPYADFSGTTDTCVEVQVTCAQGSAGSNDCDTFNYQIETNYDLPADLPAIGGPDYLYYQNQACPTTGASTAQSIFLLYQVNRVDPLTKGGTNPTNGCFVATYTLGAPVITSGSTSTFVGFNPPVSNTALNIVKAGSTVPLQWVQLDNQGNAVKTMSLCTAINSASACTAPAGLQTPWVFVQAYSVPGALCTADLTDGTDTLQTSPAGGSGLQNLSSTQPGLYQYNWKTPSGTPKGTCAEITFTYSSGAFFVTPPEFQFK